MHFHNARDAHSYIVYLLIGGGGGVQAFVAKTLVKEWLVKLRIPRKLHSDMGTLLVPFVRFVVWKGSWVRNLTWTHNERLGFIIYCREKPKNIFFIFFTMMPDDTYMNIHEIIEYNFIIWNDFQW